MNTEPHANRPPRTRALLSLLAVVALSARVLAAPPAPAPRRLEILPAEIHLTARNDLQSVVVRLVQPDGITRDLTASAVLKPANAALLRVDKNVLHPLADGQTQVTVQAEGLSATATVTIAGATTIRPIRFKLDVMPSLTRGGCNTGDCHGSARGQDGFHLSLFGYDPDGDYQALTREIPGRRINLALPAASMMLEKATGKVPHTGGKKIDESSELYAMIHAWLATGAPADPPDVPHVTAIELLPQDIALRGTGAVQQMTARATYSDGTDRDVTSLAVFMTNNKTSAEVSPGGLVTAKSRGEAQILARFDAFTVGAQVIVIPADAPKDYPALAAVNYVDEHIHNKLRKMRIVPSPLCTDEVFLRRAFIDIVGVLPTEADAARFGADERPDKRARLVDELLARKEFVEIWVMKWAERLQIRSTNQVSYKAMLLYYSWLGEQFGNNVPLDVIARELIASRGGTFTTPATNYYQMERETLKVSENVAQTFLGMRLQCTQCHNHPFDRWTMNDYYSFAAFFSQIGRKGAEDPRETIVFNSGGGEVRHPVGNRVMQPKFLAGAVPDLKGRDRRAVLAEWLTSPKNHYFARNVANFVWAHFFGRGIVEPVDDVRVSNPPSNRQLLDALAARLVEYKFDCKRLVRDICTSNAYQRATQTNPTNAQDSSNFSHAAIRRIRAEVLLDCISQVTETKNKFQGLPLGARAVQIADGNVTNYFLTTFGRAKRETVCTCEVVMEPNLSQALHLINGDTTQQRIRQGGVIAKLRQAGKTPEQIVDTLFVRCLARRPTPRAKQAVLAMLKETKDTDQALRDVFWALLNSTEFLFNH